MSEELQQAHQQSDRYARTATRAIRLLGFGLVAALVLGLLYPTVGFRNDRRDSERNAERIADIEQVREDQQIAACIQTNVLLLGARNAIIGGADGLLAISSQFTPEQIKIIHDTYAAAVIAQLPFRDCTPFGIADFLNHPPPDPGAK